MKLKKFKLTIEDLKSKEKEPVAVVSGSVILDSDGKEETINFISALDTMPDFKREVRALITEALSLKGLEEDAEFAKMFTRSLMPKQKPKKRVSKTRNKKK